jgi:hypothetical protein
MTNPLPKLAVPVVSLALSLGGAPILAAQIGVGTWAKDSGSITMTVETCCGPKGRRLTYRFAMGGGKTLMTVDSPFDGSEAPVLINGKPSGETMAIKWLDDHHTFTVLKMNGKPFGTSKATLSPDRKKLTVENDVSAAAGGQQVGKSTEVWTKQ